MSSRFLFIPYLSNKSITNQVSEDLISGGASEGALPGTLSPLKRKVHREEHMVLRKRVLESRSHHLLVLWALRNGLICWFSFIHALIHNHLWSTYCVPVIILHVGDKVVN